MILKKSIFQRNVTAPGGSGMNGSIRKKNPEPLSLILTDITAPDFILIIARCLSPRSGSIYFRLSHLEEIFNGFLYYRVIRTFAVN